MVKVGGGGGLLSPRISRIFTDFVEIAVEGGGGDSRGDRENRERGGKKLKWELKLKNGVLSLHCSTSTLDFD